MENPFNKLASLNTQLFNNSNSALADNAGCLIKSPFHATTDPIVMVSWDVCGDCNEKLVKMDDYLYRCQSCGKTSRYTNTIDETYNSGFNSTHNTSSNSTLPVLIKGNNFRGIPVMKTDPDKMKVNAVYNDLQSFNSRTRFKLPDDILRQTAQTYAGLQKLKTINSKGKLTGTVKRARRRYGAIAACLSYTCIEHGLPKQDAELISFFGGSIEKKDVSRGDKMLKQLEANGEIKLNVGEDVTMPYLIRYVERFNVDKKYIPCMKELIDVSSNPSIMKGKNSSRPSTVAIGVIHTLSVQLKLNIKLDQGKSPETKVYATFIRYYKYLVINHEVINVVLEKHGIPKFTKEQIAKVSQSKQYQKKTK